MSGYNVDAEVAAGAGLGYKNKYHDCLAFVSDSDEIAKQGWLSKQGGDQGKWRKRWFVLHKNYLFYFKNADEEAPRGSIPLEHATVKSGAEGQFTIEHAGQFEYHLASDEGDDDAQEWVDAIKYCKYSALQEGYEKLETMLTKAQDKTVQSIEELATERQINKSLQATLAENNSGAMSGELDRLRRELDRATRKKAEAETRLAEVAGLGGAADDEFGADDHRILVYSRSFAPANILGELMLQPQATVKDVRRILAEDLDQTPPLRLALNGANVLGRGNDGAFVRDLFERAGDYVVVSQDTDSLSAMPASRKAAAPARGSGLRVDVFWGENAPAAKKGEVEIHAGETVGEVRAKVAKFASSAEFIMKRRGVPIMQRNDYYDSSKYWKGPGDYILLVHDM